MKHFILGGTFALMASVAHAQATALEIANNATPAPCGGAANIGSAEFVVNGNGARAVRVVCAPNSGPGNSNAAPAGAPATGFVPAFGLLGPAVGVGAIAAAFGLGGGNRGSSTSDTQ